MYHIAVEARLTGPALGMQVARQMVAGFHFERPAHRYSGPQFNIAYGAIDVALDKVVTDGGYGVEGGTIQQQAQKIQMSTVDPRDLLNKNLLRPIADLAQDILLNTGCTLDVVVTQITGPGRYTVNRVITHTIHPATAKYHRTLRETITTPPTLGVEG